MSICFQGSEVPEGFWAEWKEKNKEERVEFLKKLSFNIKFRSFKTERKFYSILNSYFEDLYMFVRRNDG